MEEECKCVAIEVKPPDLVGIRQFGNVEIALSRSYSYQTLMVFAPHQLMTTQDNGTRSGRHGDHGAKGHAVS